VSLTVLKRRIRVGMKLKLVRHDGLRPIVVRGNVGDTATEPKIQVGMVRSVCIVHRDEFALLTQLPDHTEPSYITWPKASRVRDTERGFQIDLNDDGTFTAVMEYEFVE
jgi:hypothetical protein